MVQLVTNEPEWKRVVEAADEATAVISRLQALETGGASATTSTAQRFAGKEATDYKPHVRSGDKNSESFRAFQMEV